MDEPWSNRPWSKAVLYELHIGTFTEEGTFLAAIEKLDHLVQLGVTGIEIMPVAADDQVYVRRLQFWPVGSFQDVFLQKTLLVSARVGTTPRTAQ